MIWITILLAIIFALWPIGVVVKNVRHEDACRAEFEEDLDKWREL